MMLAAGIWVKTLTVSNSLASLTVLCLWAPTILGGRIGGIADRVRPDRLLVWLPVAVALSLTVLLWVPDALLVPAIYTTMTGYGVAFVLMGAAEGAWLPTLLKTKRLATVNGYRAAIQEGGGKIAAPALGAGLFVAVGPRWVVAISVVALLVSAALFAVLARRAPRSPLVAQASEVDGAEDGFIDPDRDLWRLVGGLALGMFAAGTNGAFLYRLIDDNLDQPPSFIGVTSLATGVGAIIMGGLSGRILLRYGAGPTVALGLGLSATGYGLLAVGIVPTALAGCFLGGAGLPMALVALFTYVQTRARPGTIGATVGRASAWSTIPLPIGVLVGAYAVQFLPASYGFLIAAAIAGAGVVWVAHTASDARIGDDNVGTTSAKGDGTRA